MNHVEPPQVRPAQLKSSSVKESVLVSMWEETDGNRGQDTAQNANRSTTGGPTGLSPFLSAASEVFDFHMPSLETLENACPFLSASEFFGDLSAPQAAQQHQQNNRVAHISTRGVPNPAPGHSNVMNTQHQSSTNTALERGGGRAMASPGGSRHAPQLGSLQALLDMPPLIPINPDVNVLSGQQKLAISSQQPPLAPPPP